MQFLEQHFSIFKRCERVERHSLATHFVSFATYHSFIVFFHFPHPHNPIFMTDLIGDIHGHATELKALLEKMGYTEVNGAYSHPTRKVVFVGDYIDRGSRIPETLAIVKAMTESGNAIALMGNHEYNVLCFRAENPAGGHLRTHSIKNIMQHYSTLEQFQNRQRAYDEYLDWCLTLPLFYETETFRAVHACWDADTIAFLRSKLENDRLTPDLLRESTDESTALYAAIEMTLKGPELTLPEGQNFKDKDGHERTEIRTKWWENPAGKTYKCMSVQDVEGQLDAPVNVKNLKSAAYYQPGERKVFFGHYWLNGRPVIYKDNVCCLDYSVAKMGKLVAYRLDGEAGLEKENLVWVDAEKAP